MVAEREGPSGWPHSSLTEEISVYVDRFILRNLHLKIFQETKERDGPEENCSAPQVNILGTVCLQQP